MLATVIRTDVAAKVSIDIMRAFVRMRHYIKYNDQLLPHKYLLLEEKVDNNTIIRNIKPIKRRSNNYR